jgi:tRNA-2-methylthio-N6-dimethylallyladenosine synthase
MYNNKKLFIKTYGCQMNVYDSLKMQEILMPFGYEVTELLDDADMVILNTCHIREKASEKVYSELGRIKAIKDRKAEEGLGNMMIVVAGCVAQAEGDEIFRRAPYVDIVVGPQSYHTLPDLMAQVTRLEKKHAIELDFIEEAKFDNLSENYQDQGASAFVSIQEGCDKFCTFCVVPYTRGAQFSRHVNQIYREAMALVAKGAKEIQLLGQNVNAYDGKVSHEDNTEYNLAQLIRHLSNIADLERIRYTTSHPSDMSDELIHLHGTESKLMPFLHLPVQSGSNKVLKAMNRKYTREEYFTIIDKLRLARPDIVLSSDFIVGFPGETDEDFADTMDLVKRIGFGQCFSFMYSPRPGTPAAAMKQVPDQVKAERLKILQEELLAQQIAFNESSIGKIMPVLFEKAGKFEGHIVGKTPYMQSVYLQVADKDLMGKMVNVKITKALPTSITGDIISIE